MDVRNIRLSLRQKVLQQVLAGLQFAHTIGHAVRVRSFFNHTQHLLQAAEMVLSGFSVNLGLSAKDVADSIMPPGMINTLNFPGKAMKDMAAVKLGQITYTAALNAKGNQVQQPHIENGVKVFDIETSIIRWNIPVRRSGRSLRLQPPGVRAPPAVDRRRPRPHQLSQCTGVSMRLPIRASVLPNASTRSAGACSSTRVPPPPPISRACSSWARRACVRCRFCWCPGLPASLIKRKVDNRRNGYLEQGR